MLMKRLLPLLCCAALSAACATTTPAPAGGVWVGAWGGSPAPAGPTSRGFENQTVRQALRITAGGSYVRIRFTNESGEKPLKVGAATISLAGPDGLPAGAPVAVTFAGQAGASIPKAAAMLSDTIALPVKALDQVSISIFLPEATGPCTCHVLGVQTVEISGPGDFTRAGFERKETSTQRPFISALEVVPATPTRAIITLGDSITDGYQSTIGANRRWPDVLAERLRKAGLDRSVVNEAISGNRVLGYGQAMFGDAAVARFDRDVLSVPGADWLVVLEGINDIGQGGDARPSAEVLIAGYQQIIERAHAHGLKVYLATLIPFEGARYYTEAGEVIRQKVNTWIRQGKGFDALIDLDAAIRDPSNPKKMKAELQSGDWLHPNDAGYKIMGEAIDLKFFR
jgi:lysophospholipase L1-like esterase